MPPESFCGERIRVDAPSTPSPPLYFMNPSPIERLATETLLQIFSSRHDAVTFPEESTYQRDGKLHTNFRGNVAAAMYNGPWQLGQVSRRWRDIGQSSEIVWVCPSLRCLMSRCGMCPTIGVAGPQVSPCTRCPYQRNSVSRNSLFC